MGTNQLQMKLHGNLIKPHGAPAAELEEGAGAWWLVGSGWYGSYKLAPGLTASVAQFLYHRRLKCGRGGGTQLKRAGSWPPGSWSDASDRTQTSYSDRDLGPP